MTHPLATEKQRDVEDRALRLFRSAAVQNAIAQNRAEFLNHRFYATRSGKATAEQNLAEYAFSACCCAANANTAEPFLFWTINLPHNWFGRSVPGARHGVDNPDNIYRAAPLDPSATYEVSGRLPDIPGSDLSFTVFSDYPGNGTDPRSLGVMTLDEIKLNADRSFTLILAPEPANGRANYLQVKPEGRVLFVRDTQQDWAKEAPAWLDIRRISGAPVQRQSEAEMEADAAAITGRAVPYWLQSMPKWFYTLPPNVLPKAGHFNFSYAKQIPFNANYLLAADEAMIFSADRQGAKYLGCQLSDPWGSSYDYAAHLTSLNAAQTSANKDGTITFVLAPSDPGVYNWLDTMGLDAGTLMLRWQNFQPGQVDPERLVRDVKMVKLAEIKQHLPPDTKFVTPEERRRQIAERKNAYNRRLSFAEPSAR